jgi:hydroxymethylpyrimidine pyrophosphatase-like HAD family hydrolase
MSERGPVLVTDLLCGAEALAERLRDALRDEQWLDAYLLAAGIGQLVDDGLHTDPLLFNRAASYLRGNRSAQARFAAAGASTLGAIARGGSSLANRRLTRARQPLAELISYLADQVIALECAPDADRFAILLRAVAPAVSSVTGERTRLPACFHSFDQHPDDVRWLVHAFMKQYPKRQGPLCVVGVRTSGSYLAPLHAAAFRACGESHVDVLTYRPGRPFLRWERAALRATAKAGGRVLITDDPPGSGTSLAASACAVAAAGVPDSRIVLLLSVFGSAEEVPEVLRTWSAVVQPWEEWSIHGRLDSQPVRHALASFAGPDTQIREVTSAGKPYAASERGHLRARFTIELMNRRTGEETVKDLVVEGAGLGYLGRQGVAVASAIQDRVPHVYGFADGLIYRDWLPHVPHGGPDGPESSTLAQTVASYVHARRRALSAPLASVDRLGGRDPAWEVAAKVLSGQYGRLAVPSRPLVLEPLMRRLLAHEHPTVLDSKTDVRHWRPDPSAAGELRKVDFYQRTFGHLDLACYDPVFDLAGAAANPPNCGFQEELREAYRQISGDQVDGERWLMYRLAQLWRFGQAGDLGASDVKQRSAAAVHDYLAELYLRDLRPGSGPLCAIDLDGVLECDQLGFPATSPTGMLALRTLIAHGYRPVLVTGRSMPEVRDRCRVFGLAGGVSEYGAALYYDGESVDLRPSAGTALLDQIRRQLSCHADVALDPQYRYAVRARAGTGPLPTEVVAEIQALGGAAVQMHRGDSQTDIVAAGINKGTGLRALAELMGDPGCAFAVGDAPPDIPMFACAQLARAPRNADFTGAGVSPQRTRHAYQAGLAEACEDLVGHRAGGCQICRPPAFAPRTKALLAVLDLRSNGLPSIGTGTAALGALAVTSRRW